MYTATTPPPSLGRITLIVTTFHLLILAGSLWQIDQVTQSNPKRLVVHTVVSSPPSASSPVVSPHRGMQNPLQEVSLQEMQEMQETVAIAPKTEPLKSEESTPVPVAPVKEIPKQPVKKIVKKPDPKPTTEPKTEVQLAKKEVKKTLPVETKKSPSLDKKTLQELQKGLEDAQALDTQESATTSPHLSPLSLPKLSNKVPVAGMVSAQVEEDYVSQLKVYLQSSLRLPDVGEVTIGLRLTAQGKVVGIDVLKKTSTLNEQYVLDHIPALSFPAWGKGSEEKYFPVTLRSK